MKKARSKSPRLKSGPQLDNILASLAGKLYVSSCSDVLVTLSPTGVLECLLQQPGVSGTLIAKSLVDGSELTVSILQLRGCEKPVCLMVSQHDVLLITSSAYDTHLAEQALRTSCSIAVRTAADLYRSWCEESEAITQESRSLSPLPHTERVQQLLARRAVTEWRWGSDSLLATYLGATPYRGDTQYVPVVPERVLDTSRAKAPNQ